MRRDLKRRSLGMMRSDMVRKMGGGHPAPPPPSSSNGGGGGFSGLGGLFARNAFARRSSHLPSSSSSRAFGGMAAIREQNYSEFHRKHFLIRISVLLHL